MDWQFGTVLWSMLVFFFWFAFIWMFVGVFADIVRRDMSGWAKAGWIFLIVVLPFFGVLVYMITRPRVTEEDFYLASGNTRFRSPSDEIAKASDLYARGDITADQYEHLKQRALA
jgi:uncharacterized membrane protein